MADPKPKLAEARTDTKVAGRSVVEQMKTPAMIERFARYAPPGIDFKPLHASAALAIMAQPLLQKAKPLTLVQAMMGVTRLGLPINTPEGHAYLIPFEMGGDIIIQVVIGYRGFLELAFRSDAELVIGGDVATIAEWEGGLFKFQKGTQPYLHHTFGPKRLEGEEPAAFAYAVASTKGGEKFDVIPWSAISRIRDGSQGYSYAKSKGSESKTFLKNPWVAHEWQMGVKTVLRRLTKTMRLSAAMASAVALDEMGEQRDIDFGSVIDIDPKDWADVTEPTNPDQHQVKTPHDPKTGEVVEDGAGTGKETKDAGPAKDTKKTETKKKTEPKPEPEGDPRPEPPAEGEPAKTSPTTTEERDANRAAATEKKSEVAKQAKADPPKTGGDLWD